MRLVHVDTSVFTQFFRKSDKLLHELILANRVSISPYVRLELLQGVSAKELGKLRDTLEGLVTIETPSDFFEVSISKIKRKGLNVGLVDFLIGLEAHYLGFSLYTHDKMMARLARELGVEVL